MNSRRLAIAVIVASMVPIISLWSAGANNCTRRVVTPVNLNGWGLRTTGSGGPVTATANFVNGPATPPSGTGSVELSVGANGDGAAEIRNINYAGTKLADLTTLSYSTFVTHDGSGGQAGYIILNIDLDGDGTVDDLIFFEPVYQSATFFPSNPQTTLALNTWQTWDALNGGWWSLGGIAGAGPGTDVKSLAAYLAAQPNAKIANSSTGLGGVRLVAGFGAGALDNFVGNVDAFQIGVNGACTNHDFELFSTPANANECKNGGWMTFNPPPPHGPFKNQGDCIQFVNTGK